VRHAPPRHRSALVEMRTQAPNSVSVIIRDTGYWSETDEAITFTGNILQSAPNVIDGGSRGQSVV
jgi:hypothetical protein